VTISHPTMKGIMHRPTCKDNRKFWPHARMVGVSFRWDRVKVSAPKIMDQKKSLWDYKMNLASKKYEWWVALLTWSPDVELSSLSQVTAVMGTLIPWLSCPTSIEIWPPALQQTCWVKSYKWGLTT
jgi:hypothetical protein